MTYRFSKTLENTYEGVQFREVAGWQPATLLKISSFIDINQVFLKRSQKYLQKFAKFFWFI